MINSCLLFRQFTPPPPPPPAPAPAPKDEGADVSELKVLFFLHPISVLTGMHRAWCNLPVYLPLLSDSCMLLMVGVPGLIQAQLLDSLFGTERGLSASSEVRAEINELITQLEAKNPNPSLTEVRACCMWHSIGSVYAS